MKGERFKISCGNAIKLCKIKQFSNENGNPYWKCVVPMIRDENGQKIAYEYINLKIKGECPYDEGRKVIIKSILGYHSGIYTMDDGKKLFYRTLECEVEPYTKQIDNDEEDGDE